MEFKFDEIEDWLNDGTDYMKEHKKEINNFMDDLLKQVESDKGNSREFFEKYIGDLIKEFFCTYNSDKFICMPERDLCYVINKDILHKLAYEGTIIKVFPLYKYGNTGCIKKILRNIFSDMKEIISDISTLKIFGTPQLSIIPDSSGGYLNFIIKGLYIKKHFDINKYVKDSSINMIKICKFYNFAFSENVWNNLTEKTFDEYIRDLYIRGIDLEKCVWDDSIFLNCKVINNVNIPFLEIE